MYHFRSLQWRLRYSIILQAYFYKILNSNEKQLLTLLVPVLLIISCSKKDDKPSTTIDQDKVSLNYDQSHQFKLSEGSTAVDAAKATWTSSDLSVGTINAAGLFKASKIGNTTIKAVINGATISSEVTVIPYSELCVEPVAEFGISMAAVKSREKRAFLEQSATSLLYKGENAKLSNVIYSFQPSGLESSILLLSPTNAVVEESAKFFAERYPFAGESDGIFFFEDLKTTVGVGYLEELGFVAVYFPSSITVMRSAEVKASKEKLKALKQAFVETGRSVRLTPIK